jgi:hypothetical protein
MAINWTFPAMDVCNSAVNGHADCVKTVHWRATLISATEVNEEGQPLSVTAYGTAAVPQPEQDAPDYVAFDDITPAIAKQWSLDGMGKTEDELEAMLTEQLDALANPPMRQALPSCFGD